MAMDMMGVCLAVPSSSGTRTLPRICFRHNFTLPQRHGGKGKAMKGEIKFIHTDGKKYHFVTDRNSLNNNQMYSFNNWLDCFASDLRHVKSIIRDIHKKATVLSATV
jgi:hypothetical protein